MATDRRRIDRARAKADRAVYLRTAARMTFQQIADSLMPCPAHTPNGDADCSLCERLYGSRASAYNAVTKALTADAELSKSIRDDARAEQLSTLDVLMRRAILDATQASSVAARARAMTAAARLLDQRARLLGLYAPTRVELTDDLDEQIRAELAALAELPAVGDTLDDRM